jgi:hypothetical protein
MLFPPGLAISEIIKQNGADAASPVRHTDTHLHNVLHTVDHTIPTFWLSHHVAWYAGTNILHPSTSLEMKTA